MATTNSQGGPSYGPPSCRTPTREAPSRAALSRRAPSRRLPSRGASSRGASLGDASSLGASRGGAASGGASSRGASSRVASSRGASSRGASSRSASSRRALSYTAPSRAVVRRSASMRTAPNWLQKAATMFASGIPMPRGAGNRAPMRDLKGWLARLLAVDVLPRWVRAAGMLCIDLQSSGDLRLNAELFTRSVLRIVLDQDRPRSQSIDTTLRRQCCTDPRKSGLTFMKILNAVCAALDFAGSTSRCEKFCHRVISASSANLWLSRYEHLVKCMRVVRLCVKNDDASTQLMKHMTDKTWAGAFADLLLKEHHSCCDLRPALTFRNPCASRGEDLEELRALSFALDKAVVDAAPHALTFPTVNRSSFSNTEENDPLCCAALLMPFNPQLAITLADYAIGLDTQASSTYGIPLEIHREMRIYDRLGQLVKDRESFVRVMMSFSKVFKFNKPPLRWWPNEDEMQLITDLADRSNAVAITVWALMVEHVAEMNTGQQSVEDKLRALKMYERSADHGDLYGVMHVAKMCLEGPEGVIRNPKRAESLFRVAAKSNVRVAISHLGDMYSGKCQPYINKDEKEAARLYQIASDAGCFRAALGLADLHESGLGGLAKDAEKAKELREFAYEKQEKKRQKNIDRPAVQPSFPVPDPSHLIRAPSPDLYSYSLPEHSDVLPRPVFSDDYCLGTNHRLASEMDAPCLDLTEPQGLDTPLAALDMTNGWDIPAVKRPRTLSIQDCLDIWR